MEYAKIEDGKIVEIGPRPKWFLDGAPVSDCILRAGGVKTNEKGDALKNDDGSYILATDQLGWVPVVRNEPEYESTFQFLSENDISNWVVEEDRVLVTYSIRDLPISSVIETARQSAYSRINSEYEIRASVLAEGYPAAEQQSWPVQIQEADIVLGDDHEPTPWIDSAAHARGIAREALAQLIKAQDTAYRQYHGALTGTRQALRDQIAAFPDDPESVAALYEIGWPEAEPETEPTT